VISTTETGRLLVWEGGLIKTEVQRPGGVPIHAGTIDSIVIDEESQQIITGGDDGFVRTWDLAVFADADRSDEAPIFEVEPLSEVSLAGAEAGRDKARVQTMLKGDGHWLVQDAQGSLYKLAAETKEVRPLLGFHAGAVYGVDTCPTSHSAVTCGQDGSVRLWDYVGKALLYSRRFGAASTCVTWAGQALDKQARTIAAGFADGVLRVFKRAKDDLVLQVAVKPHASRVSCLGYAPDAATIATGGDDGCVFFVAVDAATSGYEPVGFMAHPAASPVSCMSWAADSSVLYVGYQNGDLYELKPPSLAKVDTSVTFQLKFVGELVDTSTCRPPKPYVAPPPEPTEEEAEEAALAALADPAAAAEAAAAIAEAEAAAAAAEAAVLPPAVLSVHCLQEGGGLLLALDGQEGLLWECDGALPPVKHCRGEAPLCFVAASRSGRYALTASVDGSVATSEASSAKLGSVWRGYLHGAAPSIVACLSFDDAFLLTVGADGLYCSKIAPNQPHDAVLSEATLPLAAEEGAPAADITSDTAYSIEEEKQKAESDAREAAAAEKKLGVGGQIDRLRAEFTALLRENAALGAAEQIAREELTIDPGLKEGIGLETDARVEETKAELAWASEKAELALTKLKQTFLEQVAVHHLELHGFESGTSVSTFRSTRLAEWQQASIEEVHALISTEAEVDADAVALAELATAEPMDNMKDEKLRRAAVKAAARAARAKEWADFAARRPDEKYEAPEDVAAIEVAETRMGNFSLKTDDDYVVPEAQRVNAQKKRRQLVLLDESIHAIKLGFNERVLALRDLKKRMLAHMADEEARLHELHDELQLPPPVPPPTELRPEEEPERRRLFSEAELAAYGEQKAAAKAKAAGGGGMGAMGGAAGAGAPASPTKAAVRLNLGAAGGAAGGGASSALARGEEALRRAKLEHERSRLVEKRRRAVTSFNGALEELRGERLKLEADLKTTDLRKLVLVQELRLLKEFEKNDIALASRLEKKHGEKSEIVAKVAECQERLAVKKVEIERLLEKDKLIMAEMTQALGEGNKYSEVLLTIFKKKVKRSKHRDDGDDDDEEDEDEEDEEEEFDSDEEEEEEEEVCPPGCDPALYEKVCELREKRLEQEELYAEFQKSVEGLKKENDALIRKEKVIDKALKDTEADIQAFQTDKQGKLNQLLVVVTLQMRQVQHLERPAGEGEGGDSEGGGPLPVLPADTSESLVFASSELARLRRRISELAQEKLEARQVLRALRAENGVLQRQQGGKSEKLRELEARAYDVQMLKFGQVINLEAIESVSVNKGAEELKDRVQLLEAQQQRQLKQLQAKLRQAKLELKAATEASTASLNSVASLFQRQQKLESDLNSKTPMAGREEASEKRERQHLVQLVKIQAKEVEALKLEIKMLRRKGGHVYSAPVPA
jgi:WD40 repeat protein